MAKINSRVKFQSGGSVKVNGKTMSTDSQEYRDLYNSGKLMNYDKHRDMFISPTMDEIEIVADRPKSLKDFKDKYVNYLAEEYGSSPGGAVAAIPMSLLQLPQSLATYYADKDKNMIPSKALEIENPIGALATDMILDPTNLTGAGLFSKGTNLSNKAIRLANQSGQYMTTKTPLKNTYKYNPWAFKPDPEAYYRGIGKSGYDNAISNNALMPDYQNKVFLTPDFKYAESFSQSSIPTKFVDDGTGMGLKMIDDVIPEGFSSEKYIAEIPKNIKGIEKAYAPFAPAEVFISNNPISLNDVKIYKEDWLKRYKEVPKPKSNFKSEIDWAKWNKEIPENKVLMEEYNAIEQQSKANGGPAYTRSVVPYNKSIKEKKKNKLTYPDLKPKFREYIDNIKQ